jgi:hypothetical protein
VRRPKAAADGGSDQLSRACSGAPCLEFGEAAFELLQLLAAARQHPHLGVELVARDEVQFSELLRQKRLQVALQIHCRGAFEKRRNALLKIVQERSLFHQSLVGTGQDVKGLTAV